MSSKYLGILGISRLSYPKSGYFEDNEGEKKSRDNSRFPGKFEIISIFPDSSKYPDLSRLLSNKIPMPPTRPDFLLRPPRSRSRFFKKSGRPPRSRSRPDSTRFLSRYYPPRDISPIVDGQWLWKAWQRTRLR